MTLQTLRFIGTIRALTPISYTQLDSKGVLPTMGLENRLFLTASSLRSVMRHAATELVSELQERKPTLNDYFLMAMGGIKDAGNGKNEAESSADKDAEDGDAEASENTATVSSVLKTRFAREKNPMVTLFGSMPHGIPGALMCSHAVATEAVSQETFRQVRANDFQRDPSLAERLDEGAISAFIARQAEASVRSAAKQEVKALKKQIDAARKSGNSDLALELQAKMKEIGDGGSKVVAYSIPNIAYNAIPMGMDFTHEFTLQNVSGLEIALFVQAMDRFGLNPFIGGKRAHGLGHIAMNYRVQGREAGQRAFRDMGELSIPENMEGAQATGEIAGYLNPELLRHPISEGLLDFSEKSLAACLSATKEKK